MPKLAVRSTLIRIHISTGGDRQVMDMSLTPLSFCICPSFDDHITQDKEKQVHDITIYSLTWARF
jgi:hypothetical protein